MHFSRLLARLANIVCALLIAAFLFAAFVAVGIAVCVLLVNQRPTGSTGTGLRPTHLRHFLLPLGGFGGAVVLLLRFVLPYARRAAHAFLAGQSARRSLPDASRAFGWVLVAMLVFKCAAWMQRRLFDFFLPP